MKIAARFYIENNLTENWFPLYYVCLNTTAGTVLGSLKEGMMNMSLLKIPSVKSRR